MEIFILKPLVVGKWSLLFSVLSLRLKFMAAFQKAPDSKYLSPLSNGVSYILSP